MAVFDDIKNKLNEHNIAYEHLQHGYVRTSEDAARTRGTSIENAAKALVLKTDQNTFVQIVLSGAQRADLKRVKTILDVKNVALASPEEVLALTGCTIGSVPPFGQLFGMQVIMDEDLLTKDYVVFSAGTHHDSIRLHPRDYVRAVSPVLARFTKNTF
ncbi:MAG: YbaK/EbsC family protein [archaeon]